MALNTIIGVALWYVVFLFLTVKVNSFWIFYLLKCRPPILYMSLIVNMLTAGTDVLQKDAASEPKESVLAMPKRNVKLPFINSVSNIASPR